VKCTDTEIEIGGALSCQRMLAFLLIFKQQLATSGKRCKKQTKYGT